MDVSGKFLTQSHSAAFAATKGLRSTINQKVRQARLVRGMIVRVIPNSEVEWERARLGRCFPRPRGKPGRTKKLQAFASTAHVKGWLRGRSQRRPGRACSPTSEFGLNGNLEQRSISTETPPRTPPPARGWKKICAPQFGSSRRKEAHYFPDEV